MEDLSNVTIPALSLPEEELNWFKRGRKSLKTNSVSFPEPIEPQVSFEGPDAPRFNLRRSLSVAGQQSRSPNSQVSSIGSDEDIPEWDEANKLSPLIHDSAYDASSDSLAAARAAAKNNTCFGMVHSTRAKLLDPTITDRETFGDDRLDGRLISLQLNLKDGCAFLGSSTMEKFAVLNEEVAGVLRNISLMSSCRFEPYLEAAEWETVLESLTNPEKNTYFPVDVVLYGPKAARDGVGILLSNARIYLQHPCYEEPDTEYDNPHFLKLSSLTSALEPGDTIVLGSEPVEEITTTSQLRRRMATIYDSLTRSTKLERIEADIRVTTKLLPHQEEALYFMAQREIGPIPKEFCLWQTQIRQNQPFFEHLITGLKTTKCPLENIGGILADDMGLGKTLTVISTIIRTAENAQIFAASTNANEFIPSEKPKVSQHAISRSTLVVVPSPLLIDEWIQEIKTHCDGSLNVTIYHGRGRELDPHILADADIVLTTYHTIAAEVLDTESPLYRVIWFRVVLDEAHMVRNGTTKLFKAVSRLSAKFRWCLTGTPVQNSLEDLASLVAFIRAGPLDNVSEFRKYISSPLVKGADQGLENIRLLLDSICLRRTNKLLHLPEVFDEDRIIEFSALETSLYAATQGEMIKAIKQHDSQARNAKGYFGIFQLQLQLRRLCNHGTFQKSFSRISGDEVAFDPEEAFAHLQKRGDAKCSYCTNVVTGLKDIEEKVGGIFTICGHLLCASCIPRYEAGLKTSDSNFRCPLCLRTITKDFLVKEKGATVENASEPRAKSNYFEESGISSKLSALIGDLKGNATEGKRQALLTFMLWLTKSSIVFSCWTRSLDLVGECLNLENMPYERIDGTYSLSQRHKILERYHVDPRIRILLMTTGTGAVGLNLTIANYVYILEPQWNPMVESQAIARVLRLGQARNVKVVRYIVSDTVEMVRITHSYSAQKQANLRSQGMRSQQARKRDFASLGWKSEL
ncbi:DNA repair protein RAD5A [Lachnellula suecica]|uniref:DNA repair protein RAD5A n=1 Tax=Lachnellula suecica TaxID=602035 RepID=A0A8T9C3B4_9HELO|nr:DNA repair protein RAD5A [Lachnellula suecica]